MNAQIYLIPSISEIETFKLSFSEKRNAVTQWEAYY